MTDEKSRTKWTYTSRLQKGGALLDDMRHLVQIWNDSPVDSLRADAIRGNVLNKATRSRLADVYQRAFVPRFVEGPVAQAWKLVRPLEDAGLPLQVLRPVYYWITCKAEPLLADFCREFIVAHQDRVRSGIGTEDVLSWLSGKGCRWSDAVAIRVARGLLAALRDFGLLQGHQRKRLASGFAIPVPSFTYLAFCFRLQGVDSRSLLTHSDWELFLLSPRDVEHLFLLAHQARLLEYHAAGSVISIEFPAETAEEYAHVIAR